MGCGNNNFIWIIILVLFLSNGNNGFGNLFSACGDNTWIIILAVLFLNGTNGITGLCMDEKC